MAATKVLVQWSDGSAAEAIWEFLYDLQQKFPNDTLEDKGAV